MTAQRIELPIELLNSIFRFLTKQELLECALVHKSWQDVALSRIWRSLQCYADGWDLFRTQITMENSNSFLLKSKGVQQIHSGGVEASSDQQQQTSSSNVHGSNNNYNSHIGGLSLLDKMKVGMTKPQLNQNMEIAADSSSSTATIVPSINAHTNDQKQKTDNKLTYLPSLIKTSSSNHMNMNIQYSHFIKSLHLVASSAPWALGEAKLQQFRKTMNSCRQLTTIKIDFPALNDNDLWILTKTCSQLKKISLVSGLSSHGRITDEGLVAISTNCRQLREIYLSSRWLEYAFQDEFSSQGRTFAKSVFTARGINALAVAFQEKLQGFGMKFIGEAAGHFQYRNPSTGMLPMPSEQKNPLFKKVLRQLLQSNSRGMKILEIDWPELNGFVLPVVGECFHQLEHISIGNNWIVQDMVRIVQGNPNLNSLHLVDPDVNMNPTQLLSIMSCTSLIHHESPESLSHTNSSLSYCCNSTAKLNSKRAIVAQLKFDGIGYHKEVWKSISLFPHLEILKIRPSRLAASIRHAVDDELLAMALAQLPQLKILETIMMTDLPLVALSKSCARSLEYLDIVDGRNISDVGLLELTAHCTQLHSLFLGSAELVSDRSIVSLSVSLANTIKRLSLPFNNTNITTCSLEALASNTTRLKGLGNLPECIGYQDLLTYLPHFKKLLVLSRCCVHGSVFKSSFLNPEQISYLKKVCPNLKYISQNA